MGSGMRVAASHLDRGAVCGLFLSLASLCTVADIGGGHVITDGHCRVLLGDGIYAVGHLDRIRRCDPITVLGMLHIHFQNPRTARICRALGVLDRKLERHPARQNVLEVRIVRNRHPLDDLQIPCGHGVAVGDREGRHIAGLVDRGGAHVVGRAGQTVSIYLSRGLFDVVLPHGDLRIGINVFALVVLLEVGQGDVGRSVVSLRSCDMEAQAARLDALRQPRKNLGDLQCPERLAVVVGHRGLGVAAALCHKDRHRLGRGGPFLAVPLRRRRRSPFIGRLQIIAGNLGGRSRFGHRIDAFGQVLKDPGIGRKRAVRRRPVFLRIGIGVELQRVAPVPAGHNDREPRGRLVFPDIAGEPLGHSQRAGFCRVGEFSFGRCLTADHALHSDAIPTHGRRGEIVVGSFLNLKRNAVGQALDRSRLAAFKGDRCHTVSESRGSVRGGGSAGSQFFKSECLGDRKRGIA